MTFILISLLPSCLLVVGKLVLLAPNQLLSLPHPMITNLPVTMATAQVALTSQASTSKAPDSQALTTTTSNQPSQGNVTICANNTVENSVGVLLPSKKTAVNTDVRNATCSNAGDKTTQTTCGTASSLPLLTSSAVPPLSVQTSSNTAVPMLASQWPSNNALKMPLSTSGTQPTNPSVPVNRNAAITVPVTNKPFNNLTNSSVNVLVPQQEALSVNSIANAVTIGKHQLPNISPSESLNAPQNEATSNLSNVPSNSLLASSAVNNASVPAPSVNLTTEVTQSTSRSVFSSNMGVNFPWSTMLQTTNANISSQTQTVQSSTTDLYLPTDTTSVAASSLASLADSVDVTAPLDTSLDLCAMTDDTTAPSLMSPQSLQSMLQSMLSQADAQLLWNTMLSSPMMTSPIFKLADTTNSTATTTCTATNSRPKISPVELRSEQFTSQPSHQIAQGTELSQGNNDIIPESIQDAFSDLNVQGVSEQDRLAEEVIFSSLLSSKVKGSGYGLGININELLDDAGIMQDAFNP